VGTLSGQWLTAGRTMKVMPGLSAKDVKVHSIGSGSLPDENIRLSMKWLNRQSIAQQKINR
jgi:hypothetical protein